MKEGKMSCRTVRDVLTEAALTGVPDASLRGHFLECASCKDEFARLVALAGAIDRGVAAMTSAAPSPGFAAHVRARVAEEPQVGFAWWRGWAPATVAGVAVLVLAAWLLWPNAQSPTSGDAPAIAGKDEPGEPPAPAKDATEKGVTPAAVQQERREVAADRPLRQPRAPRARVTPQRSETPAWPEVLVTGDEWAQVVKLYELSQRGRADFGKVEIVDPTPLEEKAQPLLIARLDPIKPIVEPPPAEPQ